MIESHYDTFDRAKETFIKSIYDNKGKADAAAEYYFTALNLQRHGYSLTKQDAGLLNLVDYIFKQEEFDVQRQFLNGTEMVDDPSLQPSRVVPPPAGQPFTGANIQMNPGDPNTDSHHDIDFFNSNLFPLHGDNMAEHVAGFYQQNEQGKSKSRQYAEMENHFYNKHQNATETKHLLNSAHYGKLADDLTNHDIYERHYTGWKDNNDQRVKEIEDRLNEQNIFDQDEVEKELRKAHLEEAKEGWKDNLKFTDYLLGLEWTTPEERAKVYDYISKNGLTNSANKPLKLRGGNDWVPRLVANMQHRFSPIYDFWAGKPHRGFEFIE